MAMVNYDHQLNSAWQLVKGINKKTWVICADTRLYVQPTSSGQLANKGAHPVFRAHTRFF
jgi:hypothetical protein